MKDCIVVLIGFLLVGAAGARHEAPRLQAAHLHVFANTTHSLTYAFVTTLDLLS